MEIKPKVIKGKEYEVLVTIKVVAKNKKEAIVEASKFLKKSSTPYKFQIK